jgi:glutamine phosphoribosylpyrophosphate amidotransferase
MIYDKCGVFGIYGTRNASNLTYLGLYGLQHRTGDRSPPELFQRRTVLFTIKSVWGWSTMFFRPKRTWPT